MLFLHWIIFTSVADIDLDYGSLAAESEKWFNISIYMSIFQLSTFIFKNLNSITYLLQLIPRVIEIRIQYL